MKKNCKKDALKSLTDKVLNIFKKQIEIPISLNTIKKTLNVVDEKQLSLFKQAVSNLADKKLINKVDKGMYQFGAVEELDIPLTDKKMIIGKLDITRSGMAFLIREDGATPDVIIHESGLNGAVNKDTVAVSILNKRNNSSRLEGKVITIVKRFTEKFVDTLQDSHYEGESILKPYGLNFPIVIKQEHLNGAVVGQKVVVIVYDWRNPPFKPPYGKVTKVLGIEGESNTEMHAILEQFSLPYEFPKEVEDFANNISFDLPQEEIDKRRDFRKDLTFTIDPVDAKDFDDALSFKKLENGNYEIGVHIADVSYYMPEGSELDKEAYMRATSIYLADRVVPMLPERLSNGVCSLRPKEDKFCFAAVFEVAPDGSIMSTWLGKSVIHSDHRFAYEDVQEIIENEKGLYYDEINILNIIAKYHRSLRFNEGCIDFSSRELRFVFDAFNNPVNFLIKESKDAHKMIEEWMLLANKSVAEYAGKVKDHEIPKPFVYRIHDLPDDAKLGILATFAKSLGQIINIKTKYHLSKSYSKAISNVSDTQRDILSGLTIRSMAKAVYSSQNIGHYGLGFEYYSHFTSPIRRYPDVITHRLLFSYLEKTNKLVDPDLEDKCKHCSAQERLAVEAERASTKFMQVKYLEQYLGEVFDGVISGVKESGLFVELTANMCEGKVSVISLPKDSYVYNKDIVALVGTRNSNKYQLGDPIKVKVERTDLHKRLVDLVLA